MIVVIEGGDAAGKKTQTELLAARLGGTRFSFPNYESATGRAIQGHLKKEWVAGSLDYTESFDNPFIRPHSCDALVFQCVQTANRLELLPAIREAEARGPVVFDRYWQSAYVYGSLDGLDSTWLRTVQESPMPVASWNILIDVPTEEGFKRRPERRDRYEVDREFMEKVRQEYLKLWGITLPSDLNRVLAGDYDWMTSGPYMGIVNGLGTVEEVHARIFRACGLVEGVTWNKENK